MPWSCEHLRSTTLAISAWAGSLVWVVLGRWRGTLSASHCRRPRRRQWPLSKVAPPVTKGRAAPESLSTVHGPGRPAAAGQCHPRAGLRARGRCQWQCAAARAWVQRPVMRLTPRAQPRLPTETATVRRAHKWVRAGCPYREVARRLGSSIINTDQYPPPPPKKRGAHTLACSPYCCLLLRPR
jgi:hypothetical protein